MEYQRTSLMELEEAAKLNSPKEVGNSSRWRMLAGGLGLLLAGVLLYVKLAPGTVAVKGQASKALTLDEVGAKNAKSKLEKMGSVEVRLGDENFVQLGHGSCSLDICGCFPTFVDFEGPVCDAKEQCLHDKTCLGLDYSSEGAARLYYAANPPDDNGLVTPETCAATDFNVAAEGCARGCDQAPACLKKVCSLLFTDDSCARALGAGFQLRPDAARRTGNASSCCQCTSGLTDCKGSCVDVSTTSRFCGDCNTRCRADQVCVDGLCQCPAGSEECRGVCKQVSSYLTDRFHCGQCDSTCPVPEMTCVNGYCKCPNPGDAACDGRCVALGADGSNCGTCGNVCNADSTCESGRCKCSDLVVTITTRTPTTTSYPRVLCNGRCVALGYDNFNCGTCGNVCVGGQTCTESGCQCPNAGVLCNGQCVDDLQTSLTHCGACGNVCNEGQTCESGSCKCAAGTAECGGRCVDLAADKFNCGTCGNVCVGDQTCTGSGCQCPTAGQVACDGKCVNLLVSDSHCGACGNVCNEGQSCQSGACKCPAGTAECGGHCVNLATDLFNCGTCGNVCLGDQICASNAGAILGCKCPTSGKVACNGECVDLLTDDSNCGACGNVCNDCKKCRNGACKCPAGKAECGGRCVDLASDQFNCGTCGNVCVGDQICTGSGCKCPTGCEVACDGKCVDLLKSNFNCGACGNVCNEGQSCQNGACKCPSGTDECGGRCVNLATDNFNCGTCGNICVGEQTCKTDQNGIILGCKCPKSCDVACYGKCVNLDSDPKNCGTCGNVCSGGQTCQNRVCKCPPGQTLCNGECKLLADFQSDSANCGGCGNVCSVPGQSCVSGKCQCGDGQLVCDGVCTDVTTANNCGSCCNKCPSGKICFNGECKTPPPGSKLLCSCDSQCSATLRCTDANGLDSAPPCPTPGSFCTGTASGTYASSTLAVAALCKVWTPLLRQTTTTAGLGCPFAPLPIQQGNPNPYIQLGAGPSGDCYMNVASGNNNVFPPSATSPTDYHLQFTGKGYKTYTSSQGNAYVTGRNYMMMAVWKLCPDNTDQTLCAVTRADLVTRNVCWAQSAKPTNSPNSFDGLNLDAQWAAETPPQPAPEALRFHGESPPNKQDLLCYFNGAGNNNVNNPSWNCMGQTTSGNILATRGIQGPGHLYAASVEWYAFPGPL